MSLRLRAHDSAQAVGEGDPRAGLCEGQCGRSADSHRCAGDQGDFFFDG